LFQITYPLPAEFALPFPARFPIVEPRESVIDVSIPERSCELAVGSGIGIADAVRNKARETRTCCGSILNIRKMLIKMWIFKGL
jgi:hypothetical protein